MNTPIYDFVDSYIRRQGVRAHMPGHKGKDILGAEARDITEIAGADVLSESAGIIGESQRNASSLFGTGATLYSTEGSSLAVKAMLYAALMHSARREGRPFILAARNVHRAMIDACGLLDLDVIFIYPEKEHGLCSAVVTPKEVRQALMQQDSKPVGVYLTSPDYLGGQTDIAGIAGVCHEYDVLCLVDNAHGAYLGFLPENVHPVKLGADLCCDSAHKTLPVLTGGAYLHICKKWSEALEGYARRGMSFFGSTSPSYLILQSLDLCNRYLDERFREELAECIKRIEHLKKIAETPKSPSEAGIVVIKGEPLKIVVDTAVSGYSGTEIAEELRQRKIECEYADMWRIVLMLTPQNSAQDFDRLEAWLEKTRLRHRKKPLLPEPAWTGRKLCRKMSIREAMLSPSEVVSSKRAAGRILAQETVSCPPAVPVAVSGEQLTPEQVQILLLYGIKEVSVLPD